MKLCLECRHYAEEFRTMTASRGMCVKSGIPVNGMQPACQTSGCLKARKERHKLEHSKAAKPVTSGVDMADSAATLDAMSDTAAVTFYNAAVRYGIGKFPKGGSRASRNWKKFQQIARICLDAGVPVDRFVDTAFRRVMTHHAMVTVQDICACNPKEIIAARNDKTGSSTPQDLWNLLSCKLLDMVFSIDGVKDRSDLLDNAMYGFPAWFRVFSPHDPVQRIIIHWGDLAYEELSEDPNLDAFLATKRPVTHNLLQSVIAKI